MNNKLTFPPKKKELLWGILYLLLELTLLPPAAVFFNRLLPTPLDIAQLNCVLFALDFLVVVWIFRRFLGITFAYASVNWREILKYALFGFILQLVLNLFVSIVIVQIDPDFTNVNDSNISAMVSDHFVLMSICTVVLVPVSEELLFRGVLFAGFYNRSPIAAFAVSVLVFAAIHVVGYIGVYPLKTLGLCLLQYIPGGIALGYAYAKSDSILSPILLHTVINLIATVNLSLR